MRLIKNKEKGVSALALALGIIFIGVFGILGFQIGIGYVDQFVIKQAVKQSLVNAANNENEKEAEITADILKRVSLDTIDLTKDNIYVTKNGNKSYTVEVDYIKEVKLTKKMKLVMDLGISEETK